MRRRTISAAIVLAAGLAASTSGCRRASGSSARAHPIVGAWIVKDPNAPFPYHLYVFNADGTMQQANPDAGDARTSDSDGKGMWRARGDQVEGKWVELTADRTTHQYAGRLEITFRIAVKGDSLAATESAMAFDASGQSTSAPATPQPLTGTRIALP
jgi:hypothetical protein